MENFDALGSGVRRAQGLRQIAGNQIARNRDNGGVANRAVGVNGDVGCAAADVNHANAQFFFVFGEHRIGGNQRLQHDFVYFQATALNAFLHVLQGSYCACDDMHARIQAHATHANGLAHAWLVVNDVFLHHSVQNLVIGGDVYGFCRIFGAFNVGFGDFAIFNFDHALRIKAANVVA